MVADDTAPIHSLGAKAPSRLTSSSDIPQPTTPPYAISDEPQAPQSHVNLHHTLTLNKLPSPEASLAAE